ncbi:LLM class flavin-dependent oxidoreductase [Frankia sp. Cppng1_Ct_nod]|uniref:LLM class flavin-dependent oxidoreductase n=1 Tax=Frankia sp. Cppng1_Ct_nod TaxID=2897162 RepID=UPI0020258EA6|nr:LLM class flavin-dependent oxidoreductase [Frankia sp. Cppng1_Ct_nod]
MKIRIGYAYRRTADEAPITVTEHFEACVRGLERLRFDSLWMSEQVTGPELAPAVALAYAAGRTRRIKIGTSVMTLPGRSPARLAAALASLDQLSGGRFLPAFGLGNTAGFEPQAFAVAGGDRTGWLEEGLPLLRRFWSGEPVTHAGRHFHYDGLRVGPRPAQPSMDVWLGGAAPAALRRVGRLADGWLASFTHPAEAGRGRTVVEAAAREAGRMIDPEHFGAVVSYRRGPLPPRARARIAELRSGRDPAGGDPVDADLVVPSVEDLRRRLVEYADVGVSKFVLTPMHRPLDWAGELAEVADAVLDLQEAPPAAREEP